jgi:Tfp pilus assembly protein PilX
MKHSRRGFALYLAFLSTSVLFLVSLGCLDITRSTLDISRSGILNVISFQAADGGLEIGLARLRKDFSPFTSRLESRLSSHRRVEVMIEAFESLGTMNISAVATVFEGPKAVARRKVFRLGIAQQPGRAGCGLYTEDA